MKKAGLFLKFGIVALAATIFCSSAQAQSAEKKPGRKDVQSKTSAPMVKATVKSHPRQVTSANGVVKSQLDRKLAVQKRAAVASNQPGNGARNCTPRAIHPPNSIQRSTFNNLPKDRQQFVLDNADKYTIVD